VAAIITALRERTTPASEDAPPWLRGFGSVLLLAGVVVHSLGMSLTFRIEANGGELPWWERGLFWLCCASLGGLGAWIAMQLAMLPTASTGAA
jgi:hypothetical protein